MENDQIHDLDTEVLTNVRNFRSYMDVLKRFWWLILLISILFSVLLAYRKWNDPVIYTAICTFQFNEEIEDKLSDITNVFFQNNLLKENEFSNSERVSRLGELIKTRKIMTRVLFKKTNFFKERKEDFLINHYLDLFVYKGDDQNFYFESDSISPFNIEENSLLNWIYNDILKFNIIFDPTENFLNVKTTSTNEQFTYILNQFVIEVLQEFYNFEAIYKKEKYFELTKERNEELMKKLLVAENNYINYVNSNSAEAAGRNNSLIKTQKLSTELKKATESYFYSLSILDAATESYESQKNFNSFTIIDQPIFPLYRKVSNPLLHGIIGFILGLILSVVLIIIRKFYLDNIRKYFLATNIDSTT